MISIGESTTPTGGRPRQKGDIVRRSIIILIALILLSGCWTVKRHVIAPDGSIYTADILKDDHVKFEDGKVKFEIDGRGRPGMIEQALGIIFLNLPDVTLEK